MEIEKVTRQELDLVRKVWVLLAAALIICGVAGWYLAGSDVDTNAGFADAAAVVVMVTAIAAGIERVIEAFWNVVDRSARAGGWWPLSEVVAALKLVEKNTNDLLGEPLSDLGSMLGTATDLATDGSDLAARTSNAAVLIGERLEATKDAIANAQVLAPGSARFAAVARAGNDFIEDAAGIAHNARIHSQELEKSLAAIADKLTEATDIVAAFRENPARRTMSIAVGVGIAMLAAGFLQINLFVAILGVDVNKSFVGWKGVLATGIVMGLGTNPTHEVIKALQRRKQDTTEEVPTTTVLAGQGSATVAGPTVVPTFFVTQGPMAKGMAEGTRASGAIGDSEAENVHTVPVAAPVLVRRTRSIRRTS